jgi:hypothetical protein
MLIRAHPHSNESIHCYEDEMRRKTNKALKDAEKECELREELREDLEEEKTTKSDLIEALETTVRDLETTTK